MLPAEFYGIWDVWLDKAVRALGGYDNAHTHLDRGGTVALEYLQHVNLDPLVASISSLQVKQDLVGYLHTGQGYAPDDLYTRMKKALEKQISLGAKEITSFVDASPDIGLGAIEQAAKLREEFRGRIIFKIATSPIFGFKNPKEDPSRWETYQQAAETADVLGALPSRDERPDRVGFRGHVRMVLGLGLQLKKPVHFQVDQANDPREEETERLIQAVEWLGSPKVEGISDEEPTVWAVHVISPSCYSEERFRQLINGLLKTNIGVICCPSAAISMLQFRPILTPTHNSIARIFEMLEAGVRVKIGTDNIGDMFIPSGDGKVESEVWCATNAFRFYSIAVWAKLCAGHRLNSVDKDEIRKYFNEMAEGFRASGLDPDRIYVPEEFIGRELTCFDGKTLIIRRIR